MREKEAYRDNLEQILKSVNGKQLLSVSDVVRFTGLNQRTVKKNFPFNNCYISAATLARILS